MGDAQLFSDTFTISDINSQKYDRVARLTANNENGDTFLTLDINSEVYPCSIGERLHVLLASTLSLDGSKDDGKGWREVGRGEQSLADEYDYVCHGKIYRFDEGDEENMLVDFRSAIARRRLINVYSKAFVSFGGLLLYIEGPYKKLTPLRIDYIYLLIKK